MKIKWCTNQKNGLELIEKNLNLCKEYLIKAENSLRAVNSLKDNIEWQISAAYYSMYFSLYAILMKIGIKCEIHSCTIAFSEVFLTEFFSTEDIELLKIALKSRIDLQYYTDRKISSNKKNRLINFAAEFYIKCKEVIENLTENNINKIRSDYLNSFE